MVEVYDLGLITYEQGQKKQEEIYKYVLNNKQIDGVLIFLEVDPVITTAYSSERGEVIFSKKQLCERGIRSVQVDRGGKTTLHGPGQLICYPILNLERFGKDLHKYLRNLEEVVINILKELNIDSGRKDKYTGVWIGEEKICAMGIHIKKWITTHGIALNNDIDLSLFDSIIPCGIKDVGVTSIKKLDIEVEMSILKEKFVENFNKVFY
ncbi:lipoyl(octanoyl) transferase LipB [Psychrilyobacter sp.]|uniref:lipoyl(octanoyl) transferase LipB n=1 Tax=Psychrilyobacter sp. TaxID=2586924 RepID=UPI003016759F